MAKVTALQQLDKAKRTIRDLGLKTEPASDAPIAGLLETDIPQVALRLT